MTNEQNSPQPPSDAPPPASPEEMMLSLREASRVMRQLVIAKAQDAGLSVLEFQALARSADGQGISLGQLARELGLKKNSMTEMANRLEDRKLMRRERPADNRRIVLVHPTAKGRRAVEGALGPLYERLTNVISELDSTELERFGKLIGELTAIMGDEAQPSRPRPRRSSSPRTSKHTPSSSRSS